MNTTSLKALNPLQLPNRTENAIQTQSHSLGYWVEVYIASACPYRVAARPNSAAFMTGCCLRQSDAM